MKMTYIFFALMLGCSSSNQSMPENRFANTIWISKVAPDCVDTLKFMKGARVFSYSCEMDYTSKGIYSVKGDTLVLIITEDSHGPSEKWRYKFVMRNEILTPISSEQLWKGKWEIQKNAFDKNYVFTRLK